MSDEYESYEYLQEEGQEQPKLRKIHPADTGADTQCIADRWRSKAWFALTGTFKATTGRSFKYVAQALR